MRIGLIIAGLVVAVLGVAILVGRFSVPTDREVVKIGDFSASVQEERSVPAWAGGVVLVIGLGLAAAGAMRGR